MRAIDTNVLLRFILADDPAQAALAEETMRQDVILPLTVLLETGWVLSSTYRIGRSQLAKMLHAILDYATVHVANEGAIRWALNRYADGADLADMLHIVAAGEATHFVTFDRKIASVVGPDAPLVVETLGLG